MSYFPEILISKDIDVLRQIRSPFTNAVAWELTGSVAKELSAHAKLYTQWLDANPNTKLTGDAATHFMSLHRFSRHMFPHFDEILSPLAKPMRMIPLDDIYLPPGTKLRARPHVDKHIRVFFSFNDHMQSTRCIPKEFAGELRKTGYHVHVDKSKAVSLPGMSISIIDVSRQVHMSPETVPEERGRLLFIRSYKLNM